jgi:peroxiredoxin Q/BCP
MSEEKAIVTLKAGDKAPAFSLKNGEGKTVKLSDYKGKRVVLYFYPKDNTPGCTKQACAFRDNSSKFAALNTQVLGVSTDSVESHVKFAEKFSLSFPLLSDPDHAVAEKYGVWKEKMNYGKKYLGLVRTTFIIDEAGKIAKVFNSVKVDGHEEKVLKALGEMNAGE